MTGREVDAAVGPRREGQLTRGFLFADLRGYTAFAERNGAAAAAELLERYRSVVRGAVARHRGAEIRTEGDGFYVVFQSVSAAVECGVAIAEDLQRELDDRRTGEIGVGVGIHAGETVDTADGYVGTAVNLAARICAVARPGEVLVSDTVRALTANVLAVPFVPRGRRHLKGIAEPVALYAVRAGGASPRPAGRRHGRSAIPAAAAAIVLAVAIGAVAAIALLTGRAPAGALTSPGTTTEAPWPSSAGPTATASTLVDLSAREEQLLDHVPPLYRASCRPGPGIAGRAQLVCEIPDMGLVTYTQFDSREAMQAEYERRWRPRGTPVPQARRCREGPYERPYYGSSAIQRGRYVCWEEPYGANVAWTDEDLAIIGSIVAPYDVGNPDLYAVADWWEDGLAGPVP